MTILYKFKTYCCFWLPFGLTLCFLQFVFLTKHSAASENNGKFITITEAIKIALENNTSLEAARQGLQTSQFRVKKSRLDLFPKADLQFSYSRLDPATVRRGNVFVDVGRTLVESFGAGDPNDIRPGAYDNNFSTSLQVVQPIYNGGANWAAVNLTQAQAWGAESNLEDTRQEVILKVKTRYLQVLQAQEFVALAEKSLEASEKHLRTSRKMFDVGLRSRTEVLRWEVQKASDEGRLVQAQNNLAFAYAALKHVMGIPYQTDLSVTPVPLNPEPLVQTLEEQIEQTKTRHPGLKTIEASVDAQRAGVRLAWSAFQPKVNFVYNLGWERNNTLALDSFSFWSASVSVNIPIFHSFSNLSSLQVAKAELRQLEEIKKDSEQGLTLEVIRARLNVKSAIKRFHIARKAVEQAQEHLRVLNNTYEVGLAANIDVLDAQVAHTKAQTELINARYDYWIARAQLDRAMGVLKE
jgi:TolC family type I secretion outer membrane protein